MTTLISKTTQAGKTLTIDYISGEFIAALDGTEAARHRMPGVYLPAKQLHIFAGTVGLSKAEGQILIDAARVFVAGIVTEISRVDLVSNYHALVAEQETAYTRAHDRQDARAMHTRLSFDAQIEAARQAINDYDAAHPEETAAHVAERTESVERNRWT